MEQDTRDFTYNGTTYHIVARRRNKHRRDVRRITRLLERAGIEDDGSEFAAIVVYSTGAKGKGWTPPKATAPDDTLIAGFYEWEEQDSALTDAFMVAIYQSPDNPDTAPAPPDERHPNE